MNRHVQDITQRCIAEVGKNVQDVAAEWFRRFNDREIDHSRMHINHAKTITASTHVCNECYDKLVGFLLYFSWITMLGVYLPADAAFREDCWYEYAYTTRYHNGDHVRRRNHEFILFFIVQFVDQSGNTVWKSCFIQCLTYTWPNLGQKTCTWNGYS